MILQLGRAVNGERRSSCDRSQSSAENLATKTDPAEPVVRIYRMLYNPDLYRIVYGNLHPEEQTTGEDVTCMDPD